MIKVRTSGETAKRKILEEAEHLIHLQGYRATSLDDIARRCRMTKANLLHHFRSKEQLGLAVLDYKADCYRKNCLDQVFAPGRTADEAIRDIFQQAAEFFEGNGCKAGCFVGNIALEMSGLNPRFRERASRFFDGWSGSLAAILRTSGMDGQASPAAEAVLALYEGAIMLARTKQDPAVFGRARDAALTLVRSLPRPKPGR